MILLNLFASIIYGKGVGRGNGLWRLQFSSFGQGNQTSFIASVHQTGYRGQ